MKANNHFHLLFNGRRLLFLVPSERGVLYFNGPLYSFILIHILWIQLLIYQEVPQSLHRYACLQKCGKIKPFKELVHIKRFCEKRCILMFSFSLSVNLLSKLFLYVCCW